MIQRLLWKVLLPVVMLHPGTAMAQIKTADLHESASLNVDAATAFSFSSDGHIWACGGFGMISLGKDTTLLKEIKPLASAYDLPCLGSNAEVLCQGFNRYTIKTDTLDYRYDLIGACYGPDQHSETVSIQKISWMSNLSSCAVYTHYSPSRMLGRDFEFKGPVNRLFLVDAQTGRAGQVLKEGEFGCRKLLYDNTYITCAGEDSVFAWRVTDGALVKALPVNGEFRDIAWNAAGSKFMVLTDNAIQLYDTQHWKPVQLSLPDAVSLRTAFSPVADVFAVSDSKNRIQLWSCDATAPKLLTTITTAASVFGMAFAPDGKLFVSQLTDKNVGKLSVYEVNVH